MKKEYNFKSAKRGPVVSQKGKTRITIYIDNEIIEEFRNRATEAGSGYQTMINEALKQYLEKSGTPLNEAVIRQVIREELDRASAH
ncbi:MAG: BrnA antitoxin family protein [Pseudomonadota bacterium]